MKVRKPLGKRRQNSADINSRYVDQDLSWLEFNQRVLGLAQDISIPILERVRFLSIFSSNLDEFFMKRVWRAKKETSPLLSQIRDKVLSLQNIEAECYVRQLQPELKAKGIYILPWKELQAFEKKYLKEYFKKSVFPILTPLAFDPAHPFPYLSNLSLSLGIRLLHPKSQERLFARVKIPDTLPQMIRISDTASFRFVSLETLISNHLSELFPDMIVQSVMSFRITRNADTQNSEPLSEFDDVVEAVQEELRQRHMGRVVRLEYASQTDPWILNLLMEELELLPEDLYALPNQIHYKRLSEIYDLPLAELKYIPWEPVVPSNVIQENSNIFRAIQKNDLLIHHPYESFSSTVEKMIQEAVQDPKVLAIKMTLYRIGDDSPIIPLLIQAAKQGKQVVCVIEVKARFDEEQNIYWVERLEQAGVHVVYGVLGLKTHAKLLLVVRKEEDTLSYFSHIGTGNYHTVTSKLYTDMGLMTANVEVASELVQIFNYLTGLSLKKDYQKFLVAPINMKEQFLSKIDRERQNALKQKPSAIIAKMNNLEDQDICDALYAASLAGVPIDLMVRSVCALKPGIQNLSENIRVKSIVGRFLEHSRLFYFRNGQADPREGEFYLSSADWMRRNLEERVETAVPLQDKAIKERCWQILQNYLNVEPGFAPQEFLMKRYQAPLAVGWENNEKKEHETFGHSARNQ